jgi:hypothetical protein
MRQSSKVSYRRSRGCRDSTRTHAPSVRRSRRAKFTPPMLALNRERPLKQTPPPEGPVTPKVGVSASSTRTSTAVAAASSNPCGDAACCCFTTAAASCVVQSSGRYISRLSTRTYDSGLATPVMFAMAAVVPGKPAPPATEHTAANVAQMHAHRAGAALRGRCALDTRIVV